MKPIEKFYSKVKELNEMENKIKNVIYSIENYPTCMSCYLTKEESIAATKLKRVIVKMMKEQLLGKKAFEWYGLNDGYGVVGVGFECPYCGKENNFVCDDFEEKECESCHKISFPEEPCFKW